VTRLFEISVPDDLRVRACAGEEGARQAIYAAVAPATFSLIRRIVGQTSAAEDVFQDTMMILFERLPEFRREAPLGAWLRQIAVSRCLMYLRSPWRRVRLYLEGSEGEVGLATAPVTAALRRLTPMRLPGCSTAFPYSLSTSPRSQSSISTL